MRFRPPASGASSGGSGTTVSPLNFDGNFSKTAISSSAAGADASLITDYDHLVTPLGAASRLQLVPSPSRHEGSFALRNEVRQGDTDGGNGTTGDDRTEITATSKLYRAGNEVWMARSVFFPIGTPMPTGFYLFQQFFAQDLGGVGGGGSPPFALEVAAGGRALMATVRGGVKALASDASTHVVSAPVGWSTQGVWHDFLIHIIWSTTNGTMEVWHREAGASFSDLPDFSDTGNPNITTLQSVVLPMYPETGQYRASMSATSVIYDGGLQVRSNRRDAEACFAGAPPIPNRSGRVLMPDTGKSWLYFDEFDDGSLASDITLSTAGNAVERGNELLVTGVLDASAFAYSKVKKPAFVLTAKRLVTEIVDFVPMSQGVAGIGWELSSTNYAWFQITGTFNGAILLPTTKESGSAFNQGSGFTVYDPSAHRFLSIREASGTLFFETSPDCKTWTQIWSRVVTGGLTPASSGTPDMFYGWYNAGSAQTRVLRFGMYGVSG